MRRCDYCGRVCGEKPDLTGRMLDMQGLLLIAEKDNNNHRRHNPGYKRRDRHAFRPPVETIDQNRMGLR